MNIWDRVAWSVLVFAVIAAAIALVVVHKVGV